MPIAMFLGMAVLGTLAMLPLGAAGVSSAEVQADAPALMLLGMGITMTVPMVAWMRYRACSWRCSCAGTSTRTALTATITRRLSSPYDEPMRSGVRRAERFG